MTFGVALSVMAVNTICTVVAPAVAEARANPIVGLRLGSRGEPVRLVQKALMAKGAYVRGGVDGVYGPATVSAVKSFQQVNGLQRTGSIDAATARMLDVSSVTVPSAWNYQGGFVGLRMGAGHDDVKAVQRALMNAGMSLVGGADGSFGTVTHNALVTFQRRQGLGDTGVIDQATARSLGLIGGGSPASSASSAPSGNALRQGATGDLVRAVQQAIVRAGGYLLGGVDGVFGPGTASAVRAYQIVNDLPVTGVVDTATARVMGVSLSSSGSPRPGNPGGSLQLGRRGDAVRDLQRALIDAGVHVLGGADGIFGPATQSAVKSFQQRNGLPATGVADGATLQVLKGSNGGSPVPSNPTNGYVGLKQGSTGPAVRAVQQAITRTGLTLLGGADGVFGPATTSALKLYQRTNGLGVTGVVDAATARVMGLAGSSPRPGDGNTPVGYPVYGERGARVVALQMALISNRYSFAGGADGSFGSATTGAIIRLQQARGINPSGRVDEATARALGLSPMAVPAPPDTSGIKLSSFPVEGPCWFGDSWHAPRGGGRLHLGVDIIADHGKRIYATASGTIISVVHDQPGSLSGNAVKLAMADGTYFFYAHMSSFEQDIKVGTKVNAGAVLGLVGSTGNSAGPHLHFEVHPRGGGAINPYPLVRAVNGC
ncbi:MAG: peptidoglycan-binding protein [Acidimicrobiia bacterium]|nr:peptidoglycan-binding protein [Acidimicrobiia bacterium]